MKNPYIPFSNFVLRTPLFDIDFFKKLTASTSDQNLKSLFEEGVIKEAIFLASPELYFELEKWVSGTLKQENEDKLKVSFLKYLTRMSSRCTPFGLFAGFALGDYSDQTAIELGSLKKHKRSTRPDMNYLVALSQDLAVASNVRSQLDFYPNSTIYKSGDELRYIEYYYVEGKRNHRIIEIDYNEYLDKILNATATGSTLKELALLIKDEGYTMDESTSFIDELVESQILVSELEPSVSGPDFTEQMLNVLKDKKSLTTEIDFIKNLRNRCTALDQVLGNSPSTYLQIVEEIKSRETKYKLKYLFQADLELATSSCTLSRTIANDALKAMRVFNKLTKKSTETNLQKFKKAFIERYEDREIALYKVLDVETGIGYLQENKGGDINPLVDDLALFNNNQPNSSENNWDYVVKWLSLKVINALTNNSTKIILDDKDFEGLEEDWSDLPDTLSCMTQHFVEEGVEKIKISGFGGSSAANLLGRFSYDDSSLQAFTKDIVTAEKNSCPDQILAEIVHLPESRVGNILMRPFLRDYEIPYLGMSRLPFKNQISIDDLYLSVKNDRLVLRSKRLDKQVLPRLTNAHNFSANALPIYHFLCDLQTQGLRSWIGFTFSTLNDQYQFLPRVEYRNMVFHQARWNLTQDDIKDLQTASKKNEVSFKEELTNFIERWRLPTCFLQSEGDNELLINSGSLSSVKMLLKNVEKKPSFILTEFLHQENGKVKSSNGHYSNEMILTFYNQHRIQS